MRTRRSYLAALCVVFSVACEVEPAQPSDEIDAPWQFTIEFALENYSDQPDEYVARARLYNALNALDPVGNVGKSLRLSEGDEVYAEGVHLDVETRTQFADRESWDYSTAVTNELDSYDFEFRRPGETIEATIPSPAPFEVADIGEVAHADARMTLQWTPVEDERWVSAQHPTHDAQRKTAVSISIDVPDDGCVTVAGGNDLDAGVVVNTLDTGSYMFDAGNYFSPDRDCTYEFIFERVSIKSVPGTWTRDGLEVPTTGAHAYSRHTVRKQFVALQRE